MVIELVGTCIEKDLDREVICIQRAMEVVLNSTEQ